MWRWHDTTVDLSPLMAATLAWDCMVEDLAAVGGLKTFYERYEQSLPDVEEVAFWR